jgi:hypothetical protein
MGEITSSGVALVRVYGVTVVLGAEVPLRYLACSASLYRIIWS